jgi:hypothetical protein
MRYGSCVHLNSDNNTGTQQIDWAGDCCGRMV